VRKFLAFYRVSVQDTLTYRGPIIVWLLGNIFTVVVSVAIWLSVDAGASIGGYSRNSLITYYVLSLFFQWLLNWLPFFPVSGSIKDGDIIGSTLVKPVSLWWRELARETGWHTVAILFGIMATLVACLVFRDYLEIPGQINWPLLGLASLVGILINFSFTLCLGMVAFWTTKVDYLDNFFWIGRLFLGGQMIPLSLFFGPLKTLAILSPFRYAFSLPLEILFNRLDNQETLWAFAIGSTWVIIFVLIYKFMWEQGRKAYASFGQ
jgi:ABC-type uncharacterized transport system permease subunit